ncbi:hypothetical protein QQ045_013283 [Rhodiola kirilowii]
MVPLYSFLALIFLVSATPAAANMSNTLIPKLCNSSSRTDPNINYNFCTTSLQSAPDSPCADFRKLGMISIRLVKFNATNTRCYIKELLKNKKLQPYVKQCLKDCYELYSNVMPTVRKAAEDYKARKFYDANIELSSVMDDASTCEEGNKRVKLLQLRFWKHEKYINGMGGYVCMK